jgi:NADH-quinone oxidoreductase subunit K
MALIHGNLQGYILVSLLLFVIGLATVLGRRSLLMQFMGIELMLNGANLALLAFARWRGGDVNGTAFYLFILVVAACEAAVGLALVVALYRHKRTTDSDRADLLKR